MILQALNRYYRRMADEGNIAPEGFKRVEIPFLLVLNPQGAFVTLQDTRTPVGRMLVARSFLVPEEQGRSGKNAWKTANLLWDHYGYVLGWPKTDSIEHKEMAVKQQGSFVANIKALVDKYPDDVEITAVYSFLKAGDFSSVFAHPSWPECAKVPGCNLSFIVEKQTHLVCQNENVSSFATEGATSAESADEERDVLPDIESVCLVTGEKSSVARLHPRTPIPGAKSNAKIVSFQKNMGFDSYGKQQSYNAPTSRRAAFAYTKALNQMLARDSRQKLSVGDATAVFWAERKIPFEDLFADFFGEQSKENPDQLISAVRALFAAPETGAPPLGDDFTPFFVLGLAPNSARIAVRFWYPGTVAEVSRHIREHFDDCAIVHGPKQPEYLSLFRLLVSTATQGKSENIQPNLAGDVMKSILTGAPYPQTLLASAIRRCRAEQSKKDPATGRQLENVPYPRAALIKACLTRASRYYSNIEQEVTMSLDTTNSNPGYRLGRLFATLEKIQEEANPGINSTIRDRFYGSASSTPVAVFSQLMKLKNHHLSKLEHRGRATNMEKLIGEIMDGLSDFPTHLSLSDQGRFAVGYYHQRQDFFKK